MGIKVRGLNDIFGDIPESSVDSVVRIKLIDLDFFPQRTSMYSDDDLHAFAEDISENGVHEPILARPMQPDQEHPYTWYQVLNGRNRVTASRLAGKEDIPCLLREVDDGEAAYIVATTTLNQRHKLLPSEKAFAYQMQLDALRHQGKTSSRQAVDKLKSADLVSKTESGRTVQRYICLTKLIPSLLQLVDDGTLPLGVGGALSYLSQDEQETLDAFMKEQKIHITLEQAEHLKHYSQNVECISYLQLRNLFAPERPRKVITRDTTSIRFKKPVLKQVWSMIPEDVDESDAPDYILRALEFYKSNA